jgi:hypothetical protein
MPAYNASPFAAPVRLLYPGVPEYLWGSWPSDVSPSKLYVTSVAIASNVATVGVKIYEGQIPAVGSLISIQGTQKGAGEFNVVNRALTAVTLDANGVGTLTFALAGADLGTTADAGIAIVPQPERPEAIAAGASVPVAASNNSFGGDLDRTVTAQCSFPTLPTAVTVELQGSLVDDDSQYTTLGAIATVTGGAVTVNGITVVANWLFYRALISDVTGAGTLTCKIEA